MNKVLKGLVAVAATAAMAIAGVAGASTAMAEENTTATTNPTITFPTDTKYQDHTYEVYQIFTGDLSDGVLSNVKYGENGAKTKGTEVTAAELKQLTGVNVEGKTDQDKLDVIKTFAKLDSTPITTLTKTSTTYSAAPGYYLIKDKDGSVSGNDANTLYITKVVGDVTISPKSDVPSFQKKVKAGLRRLRHRRQGPVPAEGDPAEQLRRLQDLLPRLPRYGGDGPVLQR